VEFPRASLYNPDWIAAGVSGGAHPLWMTEWLASAMELKPGMRVLDLGCGRALSSIFLHREFGVQVWAADLWFSAAENHRRVRDAGAEGGVFPIHAEAHDLPFPEEFFDAIVSIDSFIYYGTDDLYLNYLARFLKLGGQIGIAGAGLMRDFDGPVPEHLREWWTPDCWCFHTPEWWRRHWERTGIVAVETSDALDEGWRLWIDWHRWIAPDNAVEIAAVQADAGRHLGYTRTVARLKGGVSLGPHRNSVQTEYTKAPLFRT
jgi:SAM-dependent methyltransferase